MIPRPHPAEANPAVPYLRRVVQSYQEMEMLAGPAEASPEGNSLLASDALSYSVFDCPVDQTAIEAERTFLGLILFEAVLRGDNSYFPHLSPKSFTRLRRFTLKHVPTPADQALVAYSLACNDLGKTQILIDANIEAMGRKAPDHDRLLAEMLSARSDLFPGLERLTPAQRAVFSAGLNTNFNLGQMTQGENLPADLDMIQRVDGRTRMLRLVSELYDFAGATGHLRHDRSILLTEDNLSAYLMAIAELNRTPLTRAYERYVHLRARQSGIADTEPDGYILGRIVALSRTFTVEQGMMVRAVWQSLPAEVRHVLRCEIGKAESSNQPGILLYYAPALIANAVRSFGNFEHGLDYALRVFATQFEKTRAENRTTSEPVIIVNIAALARDALQAGA